MSESVCTLQGREERLVAYLYDDLDPEGRRAFDAHVAACRVCRDEIGDLRGVREDLRGWAPPEPVRLLAFPPMARPRPRVLAALADVPAWVQAAAALLVLGVAAAVANVQVRYDAAGVTLTTGWRSGPALVAEAGGGPEPAAAGAEAAWQADLAALERRVLAALPPAPPEAARRGGDADEALMRRVRALIDASERSQRRELALRIAEIARDVQAQRTSDLQRIQRTFTAFESTTGGEIVKQRQLLNNLATWASQRQ